MQRVQAAFDVVGQEAVQRVGIALVFREVPVTGVGVERRSLVRETAHVDDRLRVDAVLAGVGGHLEDVAVLAAALADAVAADFFVRQPRVPGGGAAGTGAVQPAQRGITLDPVAVAPHQVRVAADLVVVAGLGHVVLGHGVQAGADDAGRICRGGKLVVAHQHDLQAAADAARTHHAHAVVGGRGDQAVGHQITTPAVRFVAETRRQLDQGQTGGDVLDRGERAVGAGHLNRRRSRQAGVRAGFGCAARHGSDRAGKGDCDGRGAALEQAAARRRWVVGFLQDEAPGESMKDRNARAVSLATVTCSRQAPQRP